MRSIETILFIVINNKPFEHNHTKINKKKLLKC